MGLSPSYFLSSFLPSYGKHWTSGNNEYIFIVTVAKKKEEGSEEEKSIEQ
jgi:hypothetical protein